jgi:hypothetical protein
VHTVLITPTLKGFFFVGWVISSLNNNLPVLLFFNNVGGAVFIGKDDSILLPGWVIEK